VEPAQREQARLELGLLGARLDALVREVRPPAGDVGLDVGGSLVGNLQAQKETAGQNRKQQQHNQRQDPQHDPDR
jgi:hypothetical protein